MTTPNGDPTAGLRDEFLIDPDVVFLNHGSFGACPRSVFDRYQEWQLELERQPIEFLSRRFVALMRDARQALAQYVGTAADNLVYMPNTTTGVNVVARSLTMGPGDRVLATDHEYGVCDRVWRYLCGRSGAAYEYARIRVPPESPASVVDDIFSQVDERTRVLFVSHITSGTALQLPIHDICRLARSRGIVTVVDGAHAPGQVELQLDDLGADFYLGNCHKWLCSPKGAAFLFARPEVQAQLEPLVVSWGWENERPGTSPFVDLLEYTGTKDIASYLSVPAAIEFQERFDWPLVRQRCHDRLRTARERLLTLDGVSEIHDDDPVWYNQMEAVSIPPTDPDELMNRLYERHRVEALVHPWRDLTLLRICIQGYNTDADVDALIDAFELWLGDEHAGRGARP